MTEKTTYIANDGSEFSLAFVRASATEARHILEYTEITPAISEKLGLLDNLIDRLAL